ncbi:hypothetical protein A5690_05325 [Mycobacterium intracellulare]|uniref:hypothetical protein n=1 Tax=Mycobacterium intracellulare TaxID=1767 RepID=UPI0007EBB966|nr:hypothetical protein [Mycobacterium intracellulare]OBH37885.1 hypothetical protein A5690_05325 [Mycobacterium intracellulare]
MTVIETSRRLRRTQRKVLRLQRRVWLAQLALWPAAIVFAALVLVTGWVLWRRWAVREAGEPREGRRHPPAVRTW